DLEHRLIRSVGRGAGESPGAADHPRARGQGVTRPRSRQLDQRAHPPLPKAKRCAGVKVEIFADAEEVARRAAEFIGEEARTVVTLGRSFVMAVSGGRTPWIMLRNLAAEDVPWRGVQVAQVDERIAPAGDPERNLTHLRESLLARVPLEAN